MSSTIPDFIVYFFREFNEWNFSHLILQCNGNRVFPKLYKVVNVKTGKNEINSIKNASNGY